MASRACGNKDEPLLVDTINEEPIGFDMAFAMSSIRSAQGMVARRLGKVFPSLERLEVTAYCGCNGVAVLCGAAWQWSMERCGCCCKIITIYLK